jgi:protein ImuA
MRETAHTLAALKASLSKAELPPDEKPAVPLGHPYADHLLQGGLRTGALHEIFADASHEAAAAGFAAALAFRAAGAKPILWIRQDVCAAEFGDIAPTGLIELGLDPSRLILLSAPNAAGILRGAGDALACAALGTVVLELAGAPKALDLTASQRLTLAAARHGVTAFALRFNAAPQPSAAETRWHVRGARSFAGDENWGWPLFEAHLARNRHGRTGRFLMEWGSDHGVFREPAGAAAHSGVVASPPGDGPAAAQTQNRSARL